MVSRNTLVKYDYLISRVSANLHSLGSNSEIHVIWSFYWLNYNLSLFISRALSFYLSITGILFVFWLDIIIVYCGLFLNQLFFLVILVFWISLFLFQVIRVPFQYIDSLENFSPVQFSLNIQLFLNILFSQIQDKIPIHSHFLEIIEISIHSDHFQPHSNILQIPNFRIFWQFFIENLKFTLNFNTRHYKI